MRRHLGAAFAALLFLSILVVIPRPAQAAPVTPEPGQNAKVATLLETSAAPAPVDEQTQAGERARMSAKLDARAAAGARAPGARFQPAEIDPTFGVLDCQAEPLAYERGGFVLDHFRYCEAGYLTARTIVCSFSVPVLGCLRHQEIGHAEFRLTIAGFGWDGTMIRPGDWVDPTLNQISWVALVDDFHNVWGVAPETPLTMEMQCLELTFPADCREDPIAHTSTKPVAAWMADGGQYFRWLEDPLSGNGVDNIAKFLFNLKMTYGDPVTGDTITTGGSTYRCDHALYLRGSRGCVFDDVISRFDKLDLNPASPNYQEALHVYDAFYRPQTTVPSVPGKLVPGNPLNRASPPLTRAYDLYEPLLVANNHATAVATCVQYYGDGYTQGGALDCDEYPFKSTYQGASTTSINYSARPINASDNRSGGASLGNWYTSERILATDMVDADRFWVALQYSSAGGGTGGGAPIPDSPPTVRAGADTSGDEGAAIILGGSASDLEGPPTTHWSYTPGPDVDQGATCAFSDSGAAVSTFTCTDDGTFTVTLTADDGVNAPVSDSATVHVHNVAPAIALGVPSVTAALTQAVAPGPDPWSLYRAGTAVPLRAPYTDPGTNDTQTCQISWDDGTTESVAASGGLCSRDHVYAHAGMYTIKTTVSDDDGGADSSTTMVVVYDPGAGTVSGNGWLDAPGQGGFDMAGSYSTLSAKVPDGAVTFALPPAAGLNLRNHQHLEWLVVTPDGKIAIKGTAERVPGQEVGFVLYAYDGCATGQTRGCQPGPDRFRIVVWDSTTYGSIPDGAHVIYDNRAGDGFDIDMANPQNINAGNIVIQHPPIQ
jgi:hypothetical protein